MAVQQSPIYIKPNTSGLPIVGAQPGNGLTVDASSRLLLTTATPSDPGAMTAADKSKLDSVVVANIPSADEKAALAGAGSPPAGANPYTTQAYVDAAVNAVSGEYGAPVQSIAALRAVPYAGVPDKQLRLVEDVGAIYRYDTAGTGADDGVGTILPTGNAGNGRWFKVQAATQDHEALVGLLGGGTSDHQHLTTAQVGQLPSSGEKAALAGSSGTPGVGNTFVTDGDSRLTNARAPTAHASSHASGGSDAVTLAQSQVTNLTTDLAAKAPKADPTFSGVVTSSGNVFKGSGSVMITATGVGNRVTLPGINAASGILQIRDGTLGGSDVYIIDPNTGNAQRINNQAGGAQTNITVTVDAGAGYPWQVYVASGTVPRTVYWAFLGQ